MTEYVLAYWGGPPGSPDRYTDRWPDTVGACLHTASCGANPGWRLPRRTVTAAEANLAGWGRCGNCLRHHQVGELP